MLYYGLKGAGFSKPKLGTKKVEFFPRSPALGLAKHFLVKSSTGNVGSKKKCTLILGHILPRSKSSEADHFSLNSLEMASFGALRTW